VEAMVTSSNKLPNRKGLLKVYRYCSNTAQNHIEVRINNMMSTVINTQRFVEMDNRNALICLISIGNLVFKNTATYCTLTKIIDMSSHGNTFRSNHHSMPTDR
jgi:hypothetical protein